MSLFVLDSSIAVKWVLPEPGSDEALALQDAVRHNLHEIIAPFCLLLSPSARRWNSFIPRHCRPWQPAFRHRQPRMPAARAGADLPTGIQRRSPLENSGVRLLAS